MTAYSDAVTRLDQTPLNPYYNLSPYQVTTNPGGMAGYGHRIAFFDLVTDLLTVGQETVNKSADAVAAAAASAASASSAVNAPGTNATHTGGAVAIGTGAKGFTVQTGKAYANQWLLASSVADPTKWMVGQITNYNSATGALTLNVTQIGPGAGSASDWSFSVTAPAPVTTSRQVATSGLATGGGDMSADRTINVSAAASADVRTGTATNKAMTPGDTFNALAEVTLTDAATIAVDLGAMFNGVVTLGGNRTLGAPTNAKPGQGGRIRIVQDGTGTRTLAFASAWKRDGGPPTLSTAAGATDYIEYDVVSSSLVLYTFLKAPT